MEFGQEDKKKHNGGTLQMNDIADASEQIVKPIEVDTDADYSAPRVSISNADGSQQAFRGGQSSAPSNLTPTQATPFDMSAPQEPQPTADAPDISTEAINNILAGNDPAGQVATPVETNQDEMMDEYGAPVVFDEKPMFVESDSPLDITEDVTAQQSTPEPQMQQTHTQPAQTEEVKTPKKVTFKQGNEEEKAAEAAMNLGMPKWGMFSMAQPAPQAAVEEEIAQTEVPTFEPAPMPEENTYQAEPEILPQPRPVDMPLTASTPSFGHGDIQPAEPTPPAEIPDEIPTESEQPKTFFLDQPAFNTAQTPAQPSFDTTETPAIAPEVADNPFITQIEEQETAPAAIAPSNNTPFAAPENPFTLPESAPTAIPEPAPAAQEAPPAVFGKQPVEVAPEEDIFKQVAEPLTPAPEPAITPQDTATAIIPTAAAIDTPQNATINVAEMLAMHKLWLQSSGKQGQRADFEKADLQDADLSNASLVEANFRGANLANAKLTNSNLSGADFTDANLQNSVLAHTNMEGSLFVKADFRNADMKAARMITADFSHANMEQLDLHEVDLSGSNLMEVNLQHANLRDANLSESNLKAANLTHANLENANLSDAYMLNIIGYQAAASPAPNEAIDSIKAATSEQGTIAMPAPEAAPIAMPAPELQAAPSIMSAAPEVINAPEPIAEPAITTEPEPEQMALPDINELDTTLEQLEETIASTTPQTMPELEIDPQPEPVALPDVEETNNASEHVSDNPSEAQPVSEEQADALNLQQEQITQEHEQLQIAQAEMLTQKDHIQNLQQSLQTREMDVQKEKQQIERMKRDMERQNEQVTSAFKQSEAVFMRHHDHDRSFRKLAIIWFLLTAGGFAGFMAFISALNLTELNWIAISAVFGGGVILVGLMLFTTIRSAQASSNLKQLSKAIPDTADN